MMYLKEYGLSEEDIEEIYDNLCDEDWYTIISTASTVCGLLDYFSSIGINNFKDIFMNKPIVFYQNAQEMRKYIEESNIPNLIEKLKEDADNFELLGF